ncbi:MAG: YceI family protein, partial [Hyphomicrobiaceae bacterium]
LFAERAGTVTGVLEMRGVARSIRIPFELSSEIFKPSSSRSIPHLQANGTIRRSAWGMSALVPFISDHVKLDIRTGCSD